MPLKSSIGPSLVRVLSVLFMASFLAFGFLALYALGAGLLLPVIHGSINICSADIRLATLGTKILSKRLLTFWEKPFP